MTDFLDAAIDQMRHATTTRVNGRTRTVLSRHKLLRAFGVDCEYAAMMRRKRNWKLADKLIAQGRDRTYWQLQRRHGFAAVARHSHTIDAVLTRAEARAGREAER